MASYYRRSIENFSKVAGPLYALTQKDAEFLWEPVHHKAFCTLKQLLISAPVWAFLDFTRGFILETDSSGAGLGAILTQSYEDEMVHPFPQLRMLVELSNNTKKYAITELEALGIMWAVKHFHHYLYGHHCEVHTDHKPLIALLNTLHPSGKLVRWGLTLQDVDLVIRYRLGRKNAGADALSHLPVHQDDMVISPYQCNR